MTYRRPAVAATLALVLAAAVSGAQTTPAPRDSGAGTARPGWEGEPGGRGMRRPLPARALLRGVTLTDAQRNQLRAISDRHRTEARASQDAARPANVEARSARQRGDTAAARRPPSARP